MSLFSKNVNRRQVGTQKSPRFCQRSLRMTPIWIHISYPVLSKAVTTQHYFLKRRKITTKKGQIQLFLTIVILVVTAFDKNGYKTFIIVSWMYQKWISYSCQKFQGSCPLLAHYVNSSFHFDDKIHYFRNVNLFYLSFKQ